MNAKKTKERANNNGQPDENFDDDYWYSLAGGEKRDEKKRPKMPVSGKSVLKLHKIISDKAKKDKRQA